MANRTIADVGDVDVWPTDVQSTFDNATDMTKAILSAGALPVMLGGDHSVTYPAVRGYEDEEPLHVIHFDAHIDYAPFIHDLRFTNVHPFSPHLSDAARAEPRPDRDPQPAQRRVGSPGLHRTTATG